MLQPWELRKCPEEMRDQNPIAEFLGDGVKFSSTKIPYFIDPEETEIPEFKDFVITLK